MAFADAPAAVEAVVRRVPSFRQTAFSPHTRHVTHRLPPFTVPHHLPAGHQDRSASLLIKY